MVGNKTLKTDEVQAYPPHSHPWACPKDIRQLDGISRHPKMMNFRKQRKEKEMP